MSDNVIIFGAGASADAGIPLMAGFVEKMWEFAMRGRNGEEPLSLEDKNTFNEAMKIKNELDGYHGRANFNDRNIEDILSILSFNFIGGKKADKEKLDWMLKAISRTIELTCSVKHDGALNKIQTTGPEYYKNFWKELFKRENAYTSLPTIITFNYDLVLERSLFQVLLNKYYDVNNNPFPGNGINIKYHYEAFKGWTHSVRYCTFGPPNRTSGSCLEPIENSTPSNFIDIEILKLHGSLNFPEKKLKDNTPVSPTNVVENPYILPPIINKLSTNKAEKMWRVALTRLRENKNVVIVGYSLPQTEIYMQYFLKTALGPNLNLDKIFVFDPVLFKDDKNAENMKDRYACCFAPQLQDRIVFRPALDRKKHSGEINAGKFVHFYRMINDTENPIFF